MIKTLVSFVINNIELEACLFALGFLTIAYVYVKAVLQLNYGF
jgi:hypothetical protein